MNFVRMPNLPRADVGLAAVSATYPEIISALLRLGVGCVPVGPGALLSGPIGSHADMLCFHAGGDRIVAAKGEETLCSELRKYGFRVTESQNAVRSPYPYEACLNAAQLGGKLIADPCLLDGAVLSACRADRIVPVRQGYAGCSVAVADENSLITADPGIAEAVRRAGMDVLQIHPGGIALPGFAYGFIGGACGKIGKNRMAFAGRIQDHCDYAGIKAFLGSRGIGIVALSDGPLTDVGGILPLMER